MSAVVDERRYLIPFRSTLLPQIFCDVLVIGGGVAGMRAAVEAASRGADVIMLSKSPLDRTNTSWAQGGIAGVVDTSGDSFEAHARDTMEAGAGLCDAGVVAEVCAQGGAALEEVAAWGMRFDREGDGTLHAGREGGHSASRVYHAGGDATGAELTRVLEQRVRASENVRVFLDCFALDMLTPSDSEGAPVLGAVTHHPRFGLQMIWARSTVLASGGAGQVYRETTNPRGATADGVAMAYRAGAAVADMAFVQFHPTVLYLPGAGRTLISEAVRGEGAHLLDDAGERFMVGAHELAELAPRDVVSRAIVARIASQGGGNVWLDCRHMEGFAGRFPGINAALRRFELDATRELIPVHPAAHYMVGGVRADLDGRTNVPGLLAIGEASCTGLHGANRLASNSLLEGLVVGKRAGAIAAEGGANGSPPKLVSDIRPSDHGELDLIDVKSSLRSAMWRNVGVERTGAKLDDAVDMFTFWARYTLDKIFDDPEGWEVQNMLLVGSLIARSAAWRVERRGCHWRVDAEGPREPAQHDVWRRGSAEPVGEPVRTGDQPAVVVPGRARTPS
ncbi:MAG: L-aspartate oxidase [Phycisphaerales bacterium]